MTRLRALLGALVAVAIAGCGGGTKTVTVATPAPTSSAATSSGGPVVGLTKPSAAQVARSCPKQQANGTQGGSMGCSIPRPLAPSPLLKAGLPPRGSLFPDVSSWQGTVNWDAVIGWQKAHGYKPAGIFKGGEYRVDAFAARNASELHRLHAFASMYWFLRNTGCSHELGQIIAEAHALSISIVQLDDEVPEARGYDACLTPGLKKAGLTGNEYTSPGSYPGGNGGPGNLTWIAAFGPSSPPRSPWGAPVGAWQFTDGQFGPVVSIPGIGADDVNVDYTLLEQGAPPPDPYRIYDKTKRRFSGNVTASEYNTVRTWDSARCRNPVKRAVCKSSRAHLVLLQGRLKFVAYHPLAHGKPTWGVADRGLRNAGIGRRLTQR